MAQHVEEQPHIAQRVGERRAVNAEEQTVGHAAGEHAQQQRGQRRQRKSEDNGGIVTDLPHIFHTPKKENWNWGILVLLSLYAERYRISTG